MRTKKSSTTSSVHLLLNDSTPFAIRESFNRLRTNLMYTLNDKEGCPIFAVTSDDESAGKSTVMTNIAISYAMSGKKVLLIDADMRAPRQHRVFGLDHKTAGLSELLSGIKQSSDEVIFPHYTEGLHILLAGRVPPNPSELIMSPRFEELLNECRQSFDALFIDFPPVGIVTDTLSVKDMITGYIFVVRSGVCDAKKARAALDAMKQVDAKVLGIVLNDVNAKTRKNSYKRGYYYKSKYEELYDRHHKQLSQAKEN